MKNSKYVYATDYKFMLGSNEDERQVLLPFQELEKVKESIQNIFIYLAVTPLTGHPHLGYKRLRTSRIIKMEKKDGFWEATTSSGTCYRLIVE